MNMTHEQLEELKKSMKESVDDLRDEFKEYVAESAEWRTDTNATLKPIAEAFSKAGLGLEILKWLIKVAGGIATFCIFVYITIIAIKTHSVTYIGELIRLITGQ